MKRGIATIIAAVLVISTIAGCGGSGNSKQEESAAPEAAVDEAAEPEGEAPAETAGTAPEPPAVLPALPAALNISR